MYIGMFIQSHLLWKEDCNQWFRIQESETRIDYTSRELHSVEWRLGDMLWWIESAI